MTIKDFEENYLKKKVIDIKISVKFLSKFYRFPKASLYFLVEHGFFFLKIAYSIRKLKLFSYR